jgi:hypothetical protein
MTGGRGNILGSEGSLKNLVLEKNSRGKVTRAENL